MGKNIFVMWALLTSLAGVTTAATGSTETRCSEAVPVTSARAQGARTIFVDVVAPSVVRLEWNAEGGFEWLDCGGTGAKRLGEAENSLRFAVEQPGTVYLGWSGLDSGPTQVSGAVEEVEVDRRSFWVDFERRRVAVEHTVYFATGAGARDLERFGDPGLGNRRAVASYAEVLDGAGRRLATAAVSTPEPGSGLAPRAGVSGADLTSILIRRGVGGLWDDVLGGIVGKEHQTDPDPPSGGGVVICGGGEGDGWGSREHQTDPDPPSGGGVVICGGGEGDGWGSREHQT
ncbi:MAG: hypothetical protein AAGM22_14725, partial [Acidobacteriota bacterium]